MQKTQETIEERTNRAYDFTIYLTRFILETDSLSCIVGEIVRDFAKEEKAALTEGRTIPINECP